MDAAVLATLPAYTAALVLAGRYYWSHRCAECAYRRRTARPAGRHRALGRPVAPTPPVRPALPVSTAAPALPARPSQCPRTTHARPDRAVG